MHVGVGGCQNAAASNHDAHCMLEHEHQDVQGQGGAS